MPISPHQSMRQNLPVGEAVIGSQDSFAGSRAVFRELNVHVHRRVIRRVAPTRQFYRFS